jgi:N-acetylneuraminate lyase
MIDFQPLHGLVAAVHTPLNSQGELALDAVEKQAAWMLNQSVHTVFIGGSTGESHSLSLNERIDGEMFAKAPRFDS